MEGETQATAFCLDLSLRLESLQAIGSVECLPACRVGPIAIA